MSGTGYRPRPIPVKKGPLSPYEVAKAVELKVKGATTAQVATYLGRHRATVSAKLQKFDIKALIERETEKLLRRGLDPSTETVVRLASLGKNKEYESNPGLMRVSLDAAKTILGSAGITSTGSTTINNILNINKDPGTVSELKQLSEFIAAKLNATLPEAIDV
jgi:hypothetical protein